MKTFSLEDRELIRETYRLWTPRSDPYMYFPNWTDLFSPIELNVWSSIRGLGIPMYPQFPINEYFIDFADPKLKIGIEADGKEFHQDLKSDAERQQNIEAKGWKLYRVIGANTYQRNDREEMPEEVFADCVETVKMNLEHGQYRDIEDMLRAIKIVYYSSNYD